MTTEEIISKIQQALKKCSLESSIERKDIRVKLSVKKGIMMNDVKCSLMNKTDLVYDMDLKDFLGLNPVTAQLVKSYLSGTLGTLAKNEKINEGDINARFYTSSEDFTPRVYLYNVNKPVREVTVQELTK